MTDSLPEWVPDEYDPDAPLAERLPVIAEMGSDAEIHVRISAASTTSSTSRKTSELFRTTGSDSIVARASTTGRTKSSPPANTSPFLREVDPNQDYEAYVATRKTVGRDIDVRLYGVDVDRFEDDTPEATA